MLRPRSGIPTNCPEKRPVRTWPAIAGFSFRRRIEYAYHEPPVGHIDAQAVTRCDERAAAGPRRHRAASGTRRRSAAGRSRRIVARRARDQRPRRASRCPRSSRPRAGSSTAATKLVPDLLPALEGDLGRLDVDALADADVRRSAAARRHVFGGAAQVGLEDDADPLVGWREPRSKSGSSPRSPKSPPCRSARSCRVRAPPRRCGRTGAGTAAGSSFNPSAVSLTEMFAVEAPARRSRRGLRGTRRRRLRLGQIASMSSPSTSSVAQAPFGVQRRTVSSASSSVSPAT